MDLIKIAEEAFATGKQHPSFKAGDTSETYGKWYGVILSAENKKQFLIPCNSSISYYRR